MEDASEPVVCNICGNEICCEPAHAAGRKTLRVICNVCGRGLSVESKSALPILCCGEEMVPHFDELWL